MEKLKTLLSGNNSTRQMYCNHGLKGILMDIRRGNVVDLIEGIESIDLIVTDPPYAMNGIGVEHGLSASVAVGLRECAKKLKRGSWVIIYAASSWRSIIYMVEAMRGIVEPVRIGTWVKPKSRTRVINPGWLWGSVSVIAFRKGPKNRSELSSPKYLDWIESGPVMNGRRAELPPDVAAWSVEPFVIENGIALDPFAGSGRIVEAFGKYGMTGIGFELQDK